MRQPLKLAVLEIASSLFPKVSIKFIFLVPLLIWCGIRYLCGCRFCL